MSSPADRRHQHKPLDRAALGPFLDGRQIVTSALLGQGKSNSNYDVTLDDGSRCVVRIHSRATGALEAFVTALVRDRLPVPESLYATDDLSVWGFAAGRPMRDEPAEIRVAAASLARVWETTFESSGQLRADGSIEPWPFGDFSETILGHPNVRRHLGAELFQGVAELLARERSRLGDAGRPQLVHADFNPTNVLIEDGAVSAVIDWEFAHAAEGPWGATGNLRRHVRPEHRETIAGGLADGGFDVPGDWELRAAVADLGSHLEFLTSARSDSFKATRVELVRELLEMPG